MTILRTNIINFNSGEIVPSGIVNSPKSYSVQRVSNSTIIESATAESPVVIPDMASTLNVGTFKVSYNAEFKVTEASSITSGAKANLTTLYNELSAMTATVTNHAATYGSETLGPGVYTQSAASGITGVLTLDGGGNANALFVFRCVGAFATAASSSVVLTNGAQSSNVWFVSEGASSTGANSIMKGNLLANQAAVSVGNSTAIEGRMFTLNGAAGVDASTFTQAVPQGTSVATVGETLVDFSIFCGIGNVTNTGVSTVALSIGTDSGTITGFGSSDIQGNLFPSGSDTLSKVFIGTYVDGVLFPSSQRSATRTFREIGYEYPMILKSIITVTANQVIDIRAYTTLGKVRLGPNMLLLVEPIQSCNTL